MFDHYKDVRECLIQENSELRSNKTYIEAYTILIDTTFIESHNTLIESHKTLIELIVGEIDFCAWMDESAVR